MAKNPIDELGRTTLTWPEYQKQADKLLKKVPRGENWQNYLTKELGTGFWEHEGVKVDYGFNRAHGKLKRKRKTVRTANQQQSRINREANEQFTDITSREAAKDWKKKNITDWNNKNNPTGKKLIKGTKDYNKYFRRYEHRIKVSDPFWKANTGLDYLSGDPENLTWTTKSQWDLKDAGEMKHGKNYIFDVDQYTGDVSYTPRKGFKPHEAIFNKFTKGMGKVNDLSGIHGYVTKASTAAKAGKTGKALKAGIGLATLGSIAAIGPAGAALGAIDTAQRTNKYKQTGNKLDGIQAFMAGASTATAATGIGEIVSMPLDIANLVIDAARFKRTGPIQGSRARFN